MFNRNEKWAALQEAVRQNDADKVTEIAQNLNLSRKDKYYDACVLAIECDASAALDALLKKVGKIYEIGSKLTPKAMSSSNPAPHLVVLYEAYKRWYGDGETIKDAFVTKEAPLGLIQALLEGGPSSYFRSCVYDIGLHSTEKLRLIITFASKVSDAQDTLDSALIKVAEMGDAEKTKVLLTRQADPDYAGGQALLRAGEGGYQDVVDLLLPKMQPDICDDVATQLKQKETPADIIAAIEDFAKQEAPKHALSGIKDGYAAIGADTLELRQTMSDGTRLTTLFNFSTRQQEKMTRDEAGNISHAKPVNFSELENGVVDEMRARLDALAEPAPQPKTAANDGYQRIRNVF